MTHISEFTVFDTLNPDDHQIIISGWINSVDPAQIAYELQLHEMLVKAYYGVRDLMAWEAEISKEDVRVGSDWRRAVLKSLQNKA